MNFIPHENGEEIFVLASLPRTETRMKSMKNWCLRLVWLLIHFTKHVNFIRVMLCVRDFHPAGFSGQKKDWLPSTLVCVRCGCTKDPQHADRKWVPHNTFSMICWQNNFSLMGPRGRTVSPHVHWDCKGHGLNIALFFSEARYRDR